MSPCVSPTAPRGCSAGSPGALLEVGPGQTLSRLVRQHPASGASHVTIASLPGTGDGSTDVQSMLAAAGRLWMAGAEPDWAGVHGHARRRRVPLPTYPFERKRYWVDPQVTAAGDEPPSPTAPEVVTVDAMTPATPMHTDEELMGESMPAEAVPAPGRLADVTAKLQTLFSELSGMAESELQPTVSFLDLGLDSLFLTQASTAIHKTFGVKVAFRDLLEEVSTLEAVAARIDSQLPPEVAPQPAAAPAPAQAAAPAVTTAPAGAGAAAVAPGASGDVLERVVAQQMELMTLQLEMLRGNGAASAPSARTPAPAVPGPAAGAPVAPPAVRPVPVTARGTEASHDGSTIAFGPYRPPAKGPTRRADAPRRRRRSPPSWSATRAERPSRSSSRPRTASVWPIRGRSRASGSCGRRWSIRSSRRGRPDRSSGTSTATSTSISPTASE